MSFKEILCVRCQSDQLKIEGELMQCQHCNTTYPLLNGVPILFPDVIIRSSPEKPSEVFVSSLIQAMSLPQEAKAMAQLQEIFSIAYRFDNFLLDAENQFLSRLKACGIDVTESENYQAQSLKFTPHVQKGFKQKLLKKVEKVLSNLTLSESESNLSNQEKELLPRYRWLIDYLPRSMQANTEFTSNIRIENIGAIPITSSTTSPAMASYHWRTKTGEMAIFDGCRTPFPIELAAGQQLTLPVKIKTPDQPGSYILELTIVLEGKAWLDTDAKQIPIRVVSEPLPDLTAAWKTTDIQLSYADDHTRSFDLLKDRLEKIGKSSLTLLEIGGNVHPMVFHFSGNIYNLDVDIYGLQIGTMLNHYWQKEVQFICADANHLPFADQTFDAIVLSSTLHHFPDLVEFLRSLSRKLQPGGFIAALSEPVGHYYGANIAPELLRDLLSGVNEQTFTLSEYADIFRRAGLEAEVMVDGGSLKAFLTPRRLA